MLRRAAPRNDIQGRMGYVLYRQGSIDVIVIANPAKGDEAIVLQDYRPRCFATRNDLRIKFLSFPEHVPDIKAIALSREPCCLYDAEKWPPVETHR